MKISYIKRTTIFLASFVLIGSALVAQNIELPEVTTVISADAEKAEKDALPDFSDVLELPNGSGGAEPELPGLESSGKAEIASSPLPKSEKSVYAEGLIGGGYPMSFTGNISVFRSVGESPFRFNFEHNSALGYSNHSLIDNFSDRETKLEIRKSYKKNNLSWTAGGAYKSSSDGLQGNLTSNGQIISLFNRDSYSADGAISYSFANGFEIGTSADAVFYNRYAEQPCPAIPTFSYSQLTPSAFVKWQGYGFDIGFDATYSFSTEMHKELVFQNGHRGQFGAHLEWKNDFVKLYGNTAAVVGNLINNNAVIVPFTLGIDASFPVYFANRRFSILAEGGIKSEKTALNELEEKYKFSEINYNASESSDWYGKLAFTIPLKTAFTGSASIEYPQTAYGNKTFEPDYTSSEDIYMIHEKAHQLFITDFLLSYHYEDITINGEWRSNWMDVPALETTQLVSFGINWQDNKSRYGADISVTLPINSEVETPVLNTEAFVRLTSSVRAILSVNDIIKLYTGEPRYFAGKYAARGGSALVLLKFFF